MDDYIKNIAKKLISEEIDKRIFDIENKISLLQIELKKLKSYKKK